MLRAAGDGNNHLVKSAWTTIKSIMKEEEIDYNQLGDFENMEFKNTFKIKLGPAMNIVKAAK